MAGPFLVFNPPTLDFGDVTQGDSASLFVQVTNTGDDTCNINEPPSISNPAFTVQLDIFTPLPGHATVSAILKFTAGAPGPQSGRYTWTSDAINTPHIFDVVGNSVAAGTAAISIDPPAWVFADTKTGTASAIKVFTITNTGTVNVDITAITIDAPFTAAAPIPGLPVTLAPTATLQFGVTFNPVSSVYVIDTSGVHIVSTAPSSPDLISLAGLGVPITPVFTVNGEPELCIVAFIDGSGVTDALQSDPADLDTEEPAMASRWTDFAMPGTSKTYYQLFITHEDKGAAILSVTLRSPAQTKTEAVLLGSAGNDDILMSDAEDVKVYDKAGFLEFKISRIADDGPVSITQLIHVWEDRPRLGTVPIPATITPVFTVSQSDAQYLCAFGNGAVLALDTEDLNTEEATSASRDFNMSGPGVESELVRVQINYEDKGVVTMTVTASTRRGHVTTQTIDLGTVAADETILQKLFDMFVEEEIILVSITRLASAGPLSMTGHIIRYVDRGETKKT